MWKRKMEAVEAVKFLWKRKQTRKRLTLYGDGSGSKNYSISSTSLAKSQKYFFNNSTREM